MRKTPLVRLGLVLTLLVALLGIPMPAKAYVDPGSGALIWQIFASAAIGSLFFIRRFLAWLRTNLRLRSARSLGFAFASVYALVASAMVFSLFHSRPIPRFNDIFLIGIVLTCYLFSWEPAVYLLVISLAISAYIMPPYGSFAIGSVEDWYRLVSFALVSAFMIGLVARLKARRADATDIETRISGDVREPSTVGAD